MRINPNPKCLSCTNYNYAFYDGLYGSKLLGGHHMCILPQEPIEGYTAIGMYYDEQCIDNFLNSNGKCIFYKEVILEE